MAHLHQHVSLQAPAPKAEAGRHRGAGDRRHRNHGPQRRLDADQRRGWYPSRSARRTSQTPTGCCFRLSADTSSAIPCR